jgi:hypothetical protein
MIGHCLIEDDQHNVIVDKTNHIHPGNMARIISRMLSNESNYWVNSIAFGYGATLQNQWEDYYFLPPNDGIAPDNNGWKSSLYNETYRKYLDTSKLEFDGGIEYDTLDKPLDLLIEDGIPKYTKTHRNNEGVTSYVGADGKSHVEIRCILDINKNFTFDEIALYSGITKSDKSSYQNVVFSEITDESGLTINTDYTLNFDIDGNPFHVTLNVPDTKLETVIQQLNILLKRFRCTIAIIDNTIQFYNDFSIFEISDDDFISELLNYESLETTNIIINDDNLIADNDRIEKNNPLFPELEAPRLLTHLIFEPVDKPALSYYYITYTLTIEVEPTEKRDYTDFTVPNEYRLENIFEYNATVKSDTWSIYHQLGYVPKIQVFVDNKILRDKIDYNWTTGTSENAANNQIIIKFKEPQIGTARFY